MSAALKYEVLDHGNQGIEPAVPLTELIEPSKLGHTPIFAELLDQLNANPTGNTAEEIAFDQKVNALVTRSLTLRDTPKQTPMNNELPITSDTGVPSYPVRLYPAVYDSETVESSGPIAVDPRTHGIWQNRPFQPVQVDPATHGIWTGAPAPETPHDRISMSGLHAARAAHHESERWTGQDIATQPVDMQQLLQEMVPPPHSSRAERASQLTDWGRGGAGARGRSVTKLHEARTLVHEAVTTELPVLPQQDTRLAGTPHSAIVAEVGPQEISAPVAQSRKTIHLGEPVNRIAAAHQPGKLRQFIGKAWSFVWKRRIPGLE